MLLRCESMSQMTRMCTYKFGKKKTMSLKADSKLTQSSPNVLKKPCIAMKAT